MQKIYHELNNYLHAICEYLKKENSFLLDQIETISRLNIAFLRRINDYPLDNKTVQNNSTDDEICFLAREIMGKIDHRYPALFDYIISKGELDLNYEGDYPSSCVVTDWSGKDAKQRIYIKREFNYSDVRILVHGLIHYINGMYYSKNRHCLTEFLSIYFELYAINYLLKKGMDENEIDYLHRLKQSKKKATIFYQYDTVLLAFIKFGNLNDHTFSLLHEIFPNMKKETFEKKCKSLHANLKREKEFYQEKIDKDPESLGYALSKDFIVEDYTYITGTLLAIYAHKFASFTDIVYLNNHLSEYEDKTISEILMSVGINLKEKEFRKKVLIALDEYLENPRLIDKKKEDNERKHTLTK